MISPHNRPGQELPAPRWLNKTTRITRPGQRGYIRRSAASLPDEGDILSAQTATQSPLARVTVVSALWEFRSLVAAIFVHEGIQLDVVIDDQNHKYTLLESSQVIGCISTRSFLMRGCFAKPLDLVSYHLVASPTFRGRWFAKGSLETTRARHLCLRIREKIPCNPISCSRASACMQMLIRSTTCHYPRRDSKRFLFAWLMP